MVFSRALRSPNLFSWFKIVDQEKVHKKKSRQTDTKKLFSSWGKNIKLNQQLNNW